MYPALLPLMRTTRLPVIDWTNVPRRFKGTRPFRRKTNSGFYACAITFQTQSTWYKMWMYSWSWLCGLSEITRETEYTHPNCRVQLKCDGTLEGKWRGNWRMEWVASTLHTTSEHGVSSITTADAHTSAVSSRLNWRPCRFKWTRPFRRKTKSYFCMCAIKFQPACTNATPYFAYFPPHLDISQATIN